MNRDTLRPWLLITSRMLLCHPRLTVVEDTVLLPSGLQTGYLRFTGGRDTVCIICIDDRGRVLIAHEYNHAPQRIVQEFPGGHVEENESYTDAARRELMEEVGLYPQQIREIGAVLMDNRRSAIRQRVFVATGLEERHLPHDAEEFIMYEWVDVSAVEERIRRGVIENGSLLAAWSIYRSQYAT